MSRKREKYFVGYVIFLFGYCIVLRILNYLASSGVINNKIAKIADDIFYFLLFITIIIWVVACVVNYFTNSFKNIRSCGDKLFDELDYYNRHWGETKEHYEDMINVIQYYYKKAGKVDSFVGNDLKRLYNRLGFLERQLNTKEHLFTCVISVGLSLCATTFYEYSFGKFENQTKFMIFSLILFAAVVLVRDFGIFHEGSSQIYKYELKLLEKKIADAEETVLVDFQREDMILTKQNVLAELMDRCSLLFGKKNEDIEKDIRIVEKLNLNIQDERKYNEVIFHMGKKNRQGVLFLDENNNMATEQYEILYRILRKYNLIPELTNPLY